MVAILKRGGEVEKVPKENTPSLPKERIDTLVGPLKDFVPFDAVWLSQHSSLPHGHGSDLACLSESGVHATIAGVIFGLMTPARAWIEQDLLSRIVRKTSTFLNGGGWSSNAQRYSMLREMEIATRKSLTPLERFETELHPWVGFAIMPVFALANAGVVFEVSDFTNPIALAVVCGLFLGKPLGVTLFSWAAVTMGFCRLPEGVTWPILIGGSFLTGIGFTVALFIASLALEGEILDAAKVGVLGGALLSAIVGMILLTKLLPAE